MRNLLIHASLASACLCATISALAQSSVPHVYSPRVAPVTPAAGERMKLANDLAHAAALALDLGDYASAEANARQSVAILPGGFFDELLAQSLYEQGKSVEALKEYKALVDLGADQPRTELPYALLLLKSGQYSKAAEAYNTGIKRLGLGELVRANGDFSVQDPQPEALAAAIHVAMGLNFNCTWSRGGHTQNDKALGEYKKALALQPDWGLANYYYAYGLEKLGKTSEAKAAYIQTMRVGTGDIWQEARKAVKKLPNG